jgi:xylulokinase
LRAADLAGEAAAALDADLAPYGIQIAAAFALPKLMHFARTAPELFARARRVVHQTDWIVGMLCGRYDVTDVSTALKTGVNPGGLHWPMAVEQLGIPRELLPEVVSPGSVVGHVTAEAARTTGLPQGVPVVAGCTDGTAGCLASGARQPGDLNVTLGTTLVFKAIATQPVKDPQGALYNHRHPQGGYLPGAASSTGGDWIEHFFGGADLAALNAAALRHLPTNHLAYPLVKTGERFPFACPRATGFGLDSGRDDTFRFATGLEGVAYIERLAIDRLQSLGLGIGPTVYATGGGSASELWLRIRAAVNERAYSVPRYAECAVGAAVLAAMPLLGSCAAAVSHIIRSGRTVDPEPAWVESYRERYPRFIAALRERGYL